MKKVLIALCLCVITSNAMALRFGQTCQFTCSTALAQKAIPKILDAKGDPAGDAPFYDCAKSCRFLRTQSMWYTLLANAIYQTDRINLEKTANIDNDLSNLGGDNLAQGLSFDKVIENLAIELLTSIPAYGKTLDSNRESSFMGGELLPNLHPDQFERAVRQSTPVKRYLNSSIETHQQAGQRLVKALMEKFKIMLSKFESDTDKRFGHNIKVGKKDILGDFQKQTADEKQLGEPTKSKGAWYSALPIRSCPRNCSTLPEGQKAGKDFTTEVTQKGVPAEKTLLYWCQQNCEPENYGAFFCGAFDNISRDRENFKINNQKALDKLNKTENRKYVTKNKRKNIEQCLNLFTKYGTKARANDIGVVYAYNMTILVKQAQAFDKAKIDKVNTDNRTEEVQTPGPVSDNSNDSDDDGVELSNEELDKLLAEYGE